MVTASVPEHTRLGEGPPANVLMLGTAEWDSPIATNQHYVARELARTTNVTFVESLGLRRPTLRRDDVVRMASRVRRAMGDRETPAHRPRPAGAHIVSPLVLPVHRTPTRPLNRALLRRATGAWLTSQRPRVLWTFTPVTYGLEAAADVVIYHCVDLLATFPGVDGVAVARGERSLSSRTAVAIATSTAVQDHLVAAGFPRVELLPNVADVSVFAAASRPAAERRPAVLFSGNLTVHKLDLPLLESIAIALRGHGELLLAGPLAAGGGSFDAELRRLEKLGARHLGVLTPAQLAEVAGTCAVGLIPYAINDYTRGVSPLKCFEYLSSGLAVLSTGLPAVTELARTNPHVTAAEAGDLVARLPELLGPVSDTVLGDRMASAAEHGWEGRGAVLRELLDTELTRQGHEPR
ncbi:glycosyl transferase family 1 [Micromonospora sp. WMMD812]|uniref:glycosyl transferase family 1 n=1 Tax=Micromonospora sp. WMMD812 TaxID=3015152 RepID=UPI00248B5F0E|nr:glycosyl transferase family 1 [Micromonospora sp. WMMD812]WBB70641.1 glycosyl transferase family 1 [Micromonospora sp. WMMD812]